MAKKQKAYSSPEGLRYASSAAFSAAALAWIVNFLWQLMLVLLNVSGVLSLILNIVGYGILLFAAIQCYNAYEREIQADAIQHEKIDGSLRTQKILVLVSTIVRIVLTIAAIILNIVFSSIRVSPAYRQMDAIINILAGAFTVVNVVGIFAYKTYIREGAGRNMRIWSLTAVLSVLVHFFATEIRYILILGHPNGTYNVLLHAIRISAIVSYIAIFMMFETRKQLYKPENASR